MSNKTSAVKRREAAAHNLSKRVHALQNPQTTAAPSDFIGFANSGRAKNTKSGAVRDMLHKIEITAETDQRTWDAIYRIALDKPEAFDLDTTRKVAAQSGSGNGKPCKILENVLPSHITWLDQQMIAAMRTSTLTHIVRRTTIGDSTSLPVWETLALLAKQKPDAFDHDCALKMVPLAVADDLSAAKLILGLLLKRHPSWTQGEKMDEALRHPTLAHRGKYVAEFRTWLSEIRSAAETVEVTAAEAAAPTVPQQEPTLAGGLAARARELVQTR